MDTEDVVDALREFANDTKEWQRDVLRLLEDWKEESLRSMTDTRLWEREMALAMDSVYLLISPG
jgi:hypothetical protein